MFKYQNYLKKIIEKGHGQFIGIRYIKGNEPIVLFFDKKTHIRTLTIGNCTSKNVLKKVCETLEK